MVIKVKKAIIILFICSLFGILQKRDSEIIIPEQAIRFRIIANSNNLEDQNKKMIIKEKLEKEIYNLVGYSKDINVTRNNLEKNMDKIENIIKNYNVPYTINFGINHFPSKTYKGVIYKAGEYESLVITLGEGLGENFWCVLFPPLCLLDNNSNVSDVEYKLYVKDLLQM